jgi:hemoglobin
MMFWIDGYLRILITGAMVGDSGELKDIESMVDIRQLVDTFYGKIRADGVLGPIFNTKIGERWPVHLEKMYSFWQTVLFQEHTYFGSPFPPHAQLPVDRSHFVRWMELFTSTVDALFAGPKADEAKWRAEKMAELFSSKIEYFRNTGLRPLI